MIKYRAFVKTVEMGSITKAAEVLGYSQPGLSHILTAFEERVGFQLLIRSKTAVEATEDGRKLLPYCYKILEAEADFNNMIDSINGNLSGSIRIGAPNSMLVSIVPKLINEFHNVYPNIEVFVQEDTLSNTQKNLKNGKIDAAFLTDQVSADFSFHPIFEDKICLAMHANHPFAQYEKIPTKMLNGCAFIMQMPGWDDIARTVLDNINVKPDIKHYSASDAASFAMVSNFLGVYIISELQVPLLPKNVVAREFEEDFKRTIGIALKSSKNATSAQRELVQTVKKFDKSRLLTFD